MSHNGLLFLVCMVVAFRLGMGDCDVPHMEMFSGLVEDRGTGRMVICAWYRLLTIRDIFDFVP
ncbi:hypothetical protein E2C01_090217 [Portunus trituberculatus]|uniref:Secreted protein n=1 Tax=Portunus trituberculatus TaxID=210409 RepID=A0A5B7JKB9_PORTR|nr:hypothetical protein [Portunus trituberculatus]